MQFCRRMGLITGELVAIDGSKFQAAASARKQLPLKQDTLDHKNKRPEPVGAFA